VKPFWAQAVLRGPSRALSVSLLSSSVEKTAKIAGMWGLAVVC